jgi:DNA-binding transcriptional LysR family regulator
VLEELDLARRATTAGQAEVYGNVTIGFSGALNHLTLPPLTRAVRRRHPHIALSLVGRTTTNDAVARLQTGLLDLAFVGLPITADGIDSRVISVEPLGVVAPSDHHLAGATTVELAQFADDDFVSMPAAPGSILRERMVAAAVESGFRPRVVQEVSRRTGRPAPDHARRVRVPADRRGRPDHVSGAGLAGRRPVPRPSCRTERGRPGPAVTRMIIHDAALFAPSVGRVVFAVPVLVESSA